LAEEKDIELALKQNEASNNT